METNQAIYPHTLEKEKRDNEGDLSKESKCLFWACDVTAGFELVRWQEMEKEGLIILTATEQTSPFMTVESHREYWTHWGDREWERGGKQL